MVKNTRLQAEVLHSKSYMSKSATAYIKYQKWNPPCKCWTIVSYAIYLMHSHVQIYSQGWRLLSRITQVLFINGSQQEGSWFWDPAGARVGSLRWYSGFLRQSKHMRVSLIGVNGCLSYMSALWWTGHLSNMYAATWLQIMNVCSWLHKSQENSKWQHLN